MSTPGDDGSPSATLLAAVAVLHARLDSWAAAVHGVAAEAGDDSAQALADPRLEAAQDDFYEALASFEDASLPVLGLLTDESEPDEDTESEFHTDDFFLHFVIGVPDDESPRRLDDAFEIVHEVGHAAADRLLDAGFEVPTFAASRGELDPEDMEDLEDLEDLESVDEESEPDGPDEPDRKNGDAR